MIVVFFNYMSKTFQEFKYFFFRWPQFNIPTFKVTSSEIVKKIRMGEQISLVRFVKLHKVLIFLKLCIRSLFMDFDI